jgi:hypothetical protein
VLTKVVLNKQNKLLSQQAPTNCTSSAEDLNNVKR